MIVWYEIDLFIFNSINLYEDIIYLGDGSLILLYTSFNKFKIKFELYIIVLIWIWIHYSVSLI